jgi:hypothetical protein
LSKGGVDAFRIGDIHGYRQRLSPPGW